MTTGKTGGEGGVFSFRGGFTLTFLLVLLNWCNSLCYWRDKKVPSLSSQINSLNPRNHYWKAAKTGMLQASIVRTFLPSKEVNSKMVRSTRLLTEINRLVWGAGETENTLHMKQFYAFQKIGGTNSPIKLSKISSTNTLSTLSLRSE